MSSFLSAKKLMLFGFIVVLLLAIPLTVYLVQQQQQTKTKAQPASTISFVPTAATTSVGETVSVDVELDPNINQVSFVNLVITYDSTKLEPTDTKFVPNTTAFPQVLKEPSYASGTISVTLSVGSSPQSVIQTKTKVGTIKFKALAPTEEGMPTKVQFAESSQVLSTASTDQFNENVLISRNIANITIKAGADVTPTPGPTATPTPTPTSGPTPTPVPTTATNQGPSCVALDADRATTGTAPFSITLTARGNDADGTITKVSFSFGDGQTQDVTQAGGIGTNNIAVQTSHTYQNAGTYTASATLTDNSGGVNSTTCSQVITVNAAGTTTTTTGGTTTQTVVPTTVVVNPTVAPTGPSAEVMLVGALGAVLTVVGALIFLAL